MLRLFNIAICLVGGLLLGSFLASLLFASLSMLPVALAMAGAAVMMAGLAVNAVCWIIGLMGRRHAKGTIAQ